MNKQLTEAQARVERITAHLEEKLGLSAWWDIQHKYNEGGDGDTEFDPSTGMTSAARTTACTVSQWHYRKCEITWYLPSAAVKDDAYLRWVAVHEYVHMLNAPLGQFLFDYLRDDEATVEQIRTLGHHSKLEEFVTENVARLILKALDEPVPG